MRAIIAILFLAACGEAPGNMATIEIGAWELGNGAVLGTDIDVSTTVVKSAAQSLHFLNTTPAANPILTTRDFIPVNPSRSYSWRAEIRADSVTATHKVIYQVYWFQADKTASAVTVYDTVNNAIVAAANTWEVVSGVITAPSDAAYAKIRIAKVNLAFNAYFDSVDFRPAVPRWRATRTAALTLVDTVNTVIAWDTTDEVDATVNTSTGVVTILVSGVYLISSKVALTSVPSGQDNQLTVGILVDPLGVGSFALVGQVNGIRYTNATTAGYSEETSALISLNAGDLVEVIAGQSSGANRAMTVGTYHSFFTGARIE